MIVIYIILFLISFITLVLEFEFPNKRYHIAQIFFLILGMILSIGSYFTDSIFLQFTDITGESLEGAPWYLYILNFLLNLGFLFIPVIVIIIFDEKIKSYKLYKEYKKINLNK